MKCPECGEKVSIKDEFCKSCGYPLGKVKGVNVKQPKGVVIVVLIVSVLLIGIALLNYQDAKPVIKAINEIGAVTLESEEAIQTAQNKYEHLNAFQKLFVSNKKKLEKAKETFDLLPIQLTPENVKQYFDFNQVFTDFDDQDLSVYSLGVFYHSASANMEVSCVPKQDKYYENVHIVLNFDLDSVSVYNWIVGNVEITVGSDGKGSRTEKIWYSGMLRPSLPYSNCKFEVVSASGNIYNRKPEK